MFYVQKNKLQFILSILFFIFSVYYLSKDYDLLGFFADDGTTLYFLTKEISFVELLHHSFNWDAARDLHLIWQKFFILISIEDKISNLHFYQITFYLLNVLLFCYILKKLKIDNEIILIIAVSSIFFPAYTEVVLWIHAFTMVLISTFFFLIFVILQIHLLNEKNKKKSLKLNFFSILFLLLTLFTYEQSIIVSFLIIVIINYLKFKKKIITNKSLKLHIFIYGLLVLLFSFYKLFEAGVFDSNLIKYQTGSNFNVDYQILKNIFYGFAINIREFIIFDKIVLNKINIYEIIIFNLFLLLFFYFLLIQKKTYSKNLDEYKRSIFLFFILFIASIFPLYFHYISDRHNYLPSFFMFTGIAYFLKYFLYRKINIFPKIILFICIFYSFNNFIIKFNFKKYQHIENFTIKSNFYKNIIDDKNIDLNRNKIYLINFPELRKGEVFFAHEPLVNFKLISKNENLPYVSIENNYTDNDVVIIFNKIDKTKLFYRVK